MNGCLEGFLSCLNSARSVQETWNGTVTLLKSFGFDLMMYGYTGFGSAGRETEVTTLSNFPAAYQHRYHQEQYFRDDPVVHHCISSLAPLRVGRDSLHLWPDQGRGLAKNQRRIVDEAAECGMSVGVVIPLRSPGRYPLAGMSLSNAMKPQEFERLMEQWGHIAQLAVLYAHVRLQVLLQTPKDATTAPLLSSRERECLQWVSRGLSSPEIARRASLSAKTVDFHLANAMKKLRVATRSHAVAQAMIHGLLQM